MAADLQPGDPAPDFELDTDGAGRIGLGDFAGSLLVFYFYPKDDTSGCTTEALNFTAAEREFAGANASIVGVSKDSAKSHDKFKAKHSLTFTLASDPTGATVEAYGAWVHKTLYGRQYMGIDRSTFLIGTDGAILKIWRKVKVPGHVEAVLAAVRDAANS